MRDGEMNRQPTGYALRVDEFHQLLEQLEGRGPDRAALSRAKRALDDNVPARVGSRCLPGRRRSLNNPFRPWTRWLSFAVSACEARRLLLQAARNANAKLADVAAATSGLTVNRNSVKLMNRA